MGAFPERPPPVGAPTPVRFPPVVRDRLAGGLAVWVVRQPRVPVATIALVIDRGTSSDPADRRGRAALAADLLDEGAGGRDAIALADAFERLGSRLSLDIGPDVLRLEATTLSRFVSPALDLIADVVARPSFGEADFTRVRELRVGRLRQLSRQPVAAADRAFLDAIFGPHPYGHGAIGTTVALEALTLDEARAFLAEAVVPDGSTLVVAGDVEPADVVAAARSAFAGWTGAGKPLSVPPTPPEAAPTVRLVGRAGAPQSVVRVGHVGPPRRTEAYHELLVLNAALGGQFSSRINQRLREEKGLTYGARTSFGFRRATGSFACETSVDTDRTAEAVGEILAACEDIRRAQPVTGEELRLATAALCRGYARNFETAGQLARAASQLATYDLPDSTFDDFVPAVAAVSAEAVTRVARAFVRPEAASIVVVGDPDRCGPALAGLGRPVVEASVEF